VTLILHFLRPFRARPRLFIAVMIGLLFFFLVPANMPKTTRTILSLDLGGLVFLSTTWWMMAHGTQEHMRLRARLQDENRITIMILTVGATCFSLTAIGLELHGLKDLPGDVALLHLALAGASLILSWLVTHTLFASHYAHGFYGDADGDPNTIDRVGGLIFPKCTHPDYWDFMYFSLVVGMTCQTSDVQISSQKMRRLCLSQGVLSFFFNTVILALSINIAAGLL
jgi:uncharacterized membrane protein